MPKRKVTKKANTHALTFAHYALFAVIAAAALWAMFGQPQTPRDELGFAVEPAVPVALPESYTASPGWSGEREASLSGGHLGKMRVFNASHWEIDLALLEEVTGRHCLPCQVTRPLELRLFDDKFVRRSDVDGFDLSDSSGEVGLTVTSDFLVVSVVPTGWTTPATPYRSTCGALDVDTTTEGLITLAIVHELVGHGCLRVCGRERTDDEECAAQHLQRSILIALAGRNLVRPRP